MIKILSATLFMVLPAYALAQAPSEPEVGGPAPSVGGIESRPLGPLSQCDDLIGLRKERCLQAESAAGGSSSVAQGPGTQIRAGPPVLQPPAPPPAERDLEQCEKLSGEAKDRCLKNLRAAAAADEKSRGAGAIGSSTGAGTSAAGGPSSPAAPAGAASR